MPTVRGRGKQASTPAGSSSGGGAGSSSGGGVDRGKCSVRSGGKRLQRVMAAAHATCLRRTMTRGTTAGGWPPMAPQGPSDDFVDLEGQDEEDNGTNDYGSASDQAVNPLRASSSDENNAILLSLCIEKL